MSNIGILEDEDEDDDEHEDESPFSEFRFNPKTEDERKPQISQIPQMSEAKEFSVI